MGTCCPFIDRDGLEETSWTFSFSPIRPSDGGLLGMLVATTDATLAVVGSRRLDIERELAVLPSADLSSREGVVHAVGNVLAKNRQAVPFAVVYLPDRGLGLVQVARYHRGGRFTENVPAGGGGRHTPRRPMPGLRRMLASRARQRAAPREAQ